MNPPLQKIHGKQMIQYNTNFLQNVHEIVKVRKTGQTKGQRMSESIIRLCNRWQSLIETKFKALSSKCI